MATDNKIRDEELQYDINREAAKLIKMIKTIKMNFLRVKKYYHLVKVE